MVIGTCAVQFLHYIPVYRNTKHYVTLNCSVGTSLRTGGTYNMLRIIHKILYETYFSILFNVREIARCNFICKIRYYFGYFNTETFYSQLPNEMQIQKVLCISKPFQKTF